MINRLIQNIREKNAPVVVGLDPMLSYVPESIRRKAFHQYGETLEGAAEAVWEFNKEIVDATLTNTVDQNKKDINQKVDLLKDYVNNDVSNKIVAYVNNVSNNIVNYINEIGRASCRERV